MTDELRKIIGQRLKEARSQKRYTQRDLGLLVGLSDKSISAYEKGKVIPPLEILVKIAEELEKPVSYFLEKEVDSEAVLKEEVAALVREVERLSKRVRELQEKVS